MKEADQHGRPLFRVDKRMGLVYTIGMAKDIIHDQVKNALIKDGWTITHDPYRIRYEGVEVKADLAIQHPNDTTQRIVIEIKSFQGRSFISEFEKAIGQYRIYQQYLQLNGLDYEVYLATSKDAYDVHINRKAILVLIEFNEIDLLIVNTKNEEVVQWVK